MSGAEFIDGLHVERHRDGSVRARGPVVDGRPDGYWEWFRLDGTTLRSGAFDRGRQVGEWTTYDRSGARTRSPTRAEVADVAGARRGPAGMARGTSASRR